MPVTIAPTTTNINFSPYTWKVSGGTAKTINAGAYFKVNLIGSATCNLKFDMTGILTPVPQISYRFDSFGPWINTEISSSVSLTLPSELAPYYTNHFLHVKVKATTETQARWNTQATAVILTGIEIDTLGSLTQPLKSPLNVIFYGDSITEGVRTMSTTAPAKDTDRNDAGQCWSTMLGEAFGCEYGIVGFGGTGVVKATGSGSVPNLQTSYNQLWNGEPRVFDPSPNLIVINDGTNDTNSGGNAAILEAGMANVLNGMLTACPNAVIATMKPFNSNKGINWINGIAACSNPQRVVYIDTDGMFVTSDPANSSDNLHPYGYANVNRIFPSLFQQLYQLLYPGRGLSNRFYPPVSIP
jgi:hypothetical protein